MPDCTKSTLTPELAQEALDTLANALRSLDAQLERITQDLDTSTGDALPQEIVGTIGAVRRDLLVDAIETLQALATKTEADVLADRERVLYLVEAIQ